MLITFEGIDGCGKSTQIGLLEEWLNRNGIEFSTFREPGGTELSERIRELLLGAGQQIDPVTELLLFSAARSQLITEKVKPLLDNGQIVLLDRFYDSTTAYQGYGRESVPLSQIQVLNRMAGHGLVPDITFYLQITIDEAERRTASFEKDRMEKSGSGFFKKVKRGFDALSTGHPRFVILDASQSREEIHDQLVQVVQNHLS